MKKGGKLRPLYEAVGASIIMHYPTASAKYGHAHKFTRRIIYCAKRAGLGDSFEEVDFTLKQWSVLIKNK